MFIRRTKVKTQHGTYTYLQLVQKYRDPETGKPKDRILCHLGSADKVDEAQIRRLIKSLSRLLSAEEQTAVLGQLEGLDEDLRVLSSLEYGGSYVLEQLWRRLEIDKVLRRKLRGRAYAQDVERLLFALVANRALAPSSKLALERWVGKRVHIEGLSAVSVHNLYRAMEFVLEQGEELERAIFASVATLLNLSVDVVFFDTTSSYFEVEEEDAFRRYGYSKDHRPDRPQVVIGMAVTREGIPVRLWVWPGNTADASVVEQVQRELKGWRLGRILWVADRGFGGAEQKRLLQRGGDGVLVGERLRGSRVGREVLSRPGRYRRVDEQLQVKEVETAQGRYLLVRNLEEERRDRERREEVLARLEEELAALQGRGHTQAVCRLRSHPVYGRYLKELKTGELRIDRRKVAEDARYDGKYLLYTSDRELEAAEAALGYKQLLQVERGFRSLKQELSLRPIYHRREDRIRSHIFLCYLALVLIRVAERETGLSWRRLREELAQLHLVELERRGGGKIWLISEPSAPCRQILRSLDIPVPARTDKIEAT